MTGTPPIFITLIKDSTILETKTQDLEFVLLDEGNYSCLAVNNYGDLTKVDLRVVFIGRY